MKARRLFSTILVACFLMQLASCGSTPSVSDTTPANNTPTDSAPPIESTVIPEDTTAEAPEYVKPSVSYNGDTITFATYDYVGAWRILSYNNLIKEETGDILNDSIVARNRDVESDLNVTLAMYQLGEGDRSSLDKIREMIIAGDDTVDFAMVMSAGLAPLMTLPGMLYDLNAVSDLNLSASWWNQSANNEYTIYGKQYAAVGDICFFNYGAPIVTYFSKQLIEDNTLDNPYQLVYDGTWTFDKMAEIATKVARDLNGDGKMDKDDLFGLAVEESTLGYSLIASGVRYSEHAKDGDIRITVNTERTADICKKLIAFFHDEDVTLLPSVFRKKFNYYPNNNFSDYYMPKLMQNELLFFENQLHVALSLREMENDFGILPLPKYDEGQKDYISVSNTWFSDHLIVPGINTKLDRTADVIESMSYYSQQYIRPAFIDSSIKYKSLRDKDSANMIELVYNTLVFDCAYLFDWGKVTSTFSTMSKENNPNFASEYAKIETVIAAELEKTLQEIKNN